MVNIAGFWELGWNTPIKEIDLWEYPLKDFGVSKLYMNPITGVYNQFVEEYETFEEILAQAQDATIVYVVENGASTLREFQHPTNAFYIFGKASINPFNAYGKEGDLSVRIETVENQGLLWPHQAASLVLYDRMLKSWQ